MSLVLSILLAAAGLGDVPVERGQIYNEIGGNIVNYNGIKYIRIGDLLYDVTAGTTSAKIGNTIYHSDGTQQLIIEQGRFKFDLDNNVTCYKNRCY